LGMKRSGWNSRGCLYKWWVPWSKRGAWVKVCVCGLSYGCVACGCVYDGGGANG
jgi:hypothetical protein